MARSMAARGVAHSLKEVAPIIAKLIQDYDLPFDVAEYSRQAASYLYLYPELMRRRSWITVGRAPYRAPEILELMPSTLDGNFTMDPLPDNLQALYDTCFEEGEPLD